MLQKIFLACILLFFQSCKEQKVENISKQPTNNNFNKKDSIKSITIDSSLLTKAFEDIYFGNKETLNYSKEYTIADLPFNIKYENTNEEFGLYGFVLASKPLCDYISYTSKIEDIKRVISVKYSNIKKFKLNNEPTKYSELQNKFSHNQHYLPPGDHFKNKFYEFKNNGITIVIYTTTFYRPNDGDPKFEVYCPTNQKFQKYFIITLDFSKDKVREIIKERYNKRIKQEVDGYKFVLKKDAAKF